MGYKVPGGVYHTIHLVYNYEMV